MQGKASIDWGMRTLASLGILVATGVSVQAQNSAPAQATLQIITPAAGTVVNPGQTIVVYVSTSGSPFGGVSLAAPELQITSTLILNAPPYQFSLGIPSRTTPGPYTIKALGMGSGSPIFSNPVMIDVERADSPRSIAIDSALLQMSIGDKTSIRVFGTYSDGSVVDLSSSIRTKYELTSADVTSVSSEGLVTAVAPGSTTIVVRHLDRQAIVKVKVTRDRE